MKMTTVTNHQQKRAANHFESTFQSWVPLYVFYRIGIYAERSHGVFYFLVVARCCHRVISARNRKLTSSFGASSHRPHMRIVICYAVPASGVRADHKTTLEAIRQDNHKTCLRLRRARKKQREKKTIGHVYRSIFITHTVRSPRGSLYYGVDFELFVAHRHASGAADTQNAKNAHENKEQTP